MQITIHEHTARLTAFQWKVLKIALTIPFGETRTYQWVAKQAGSPGASRAVGQALRRNPYPGIIPCHRVVKSDGTPGGYEGGSPKRKLALLAIEQKIAGQMRSHH
ncbi:MAG: MGMT family protein [Candidatus Omnitrophica bacterium]|nr:MGMT family protein [Candidatus Omnitrophota bacterium]